MQSEETEECSEAIYGNGEQYRGCQTITMTDRECTASGHGKEITKVTDIQLSTRQHPGVGSEPESQQIV